MLFKKLSILIAILGMVTLFTVCKSSDKSGEETTTTEQGNSSEMDEDASIDLPGSQDPDEKRARSASTGAQKKGCIKGDCVNGFGVYVYENGDTYTGNFKDDKRDGEGGFKYSNGETFAGNYKEDYRSGKGVYQFSNGDKFAGDFNQGEITGPGVYTFADGKVLKGNFTDNGQNGEGTLVDGGKTRNCKIQARKLSCE